MCGKLKDKPSFVNVHTDRLYSRKIAGKAHSWRAVIQLACLSL